MHRNVVLVVVILCSSSLAYNIERIESEPSPVKQMIVIRLSDEENKPIVSRETINHVHHKHEHTIGNLHIVTHINIANVISVLNATDSQMRTGSKDHERIDDFMMSELDFFCLD